MRSRPVLFGAMVVVTSGVFFACGSRSALPGDLEEESSSNDDSGTDARRPRDTGPDTNLPPIDARPPVDANRDDCPDADATLVYLITQNNQLLSFYPTDGAFTLIGTIACPADPSSNPFSMAVDRRGVAYVEFNPSNELFRVSTATAACVSTAHVPFDQGFGSFGMGFATVGAGPAERLFIAGDEDTGNGDLGSIELPSFATTDIGPFSGGVYRAELTGTGDGRLFAFWTDQFGSTTNISEIDQTSGNVIGNDVIPGVTVGQGWAFGFWGGNFYMFTSQDDVTSTVTRFDPVTKSVAQVATYPDVIVGAGVSTCAPQQ